MLSRWSLPQRVERLQQDELLEVAHDRRREGLLALGVRLRARARRPAPRASPARHRLRARPRAGCRRRLNCANTASSSAFQSHSSDAHLVAANGCRPGPRRARRSSRMHVAPSGPRAPSSVAAPGVDHLALLVEDVVVLEQMLADVEVVRLDLLLRVADGARDRSGARSARPPPCRAASSAFCMRSAPKMRSRSSSSER